jgi:5-methylcytosine-specific restriction protein A
MAPRNPAWDYDELILALELYLRREQPSASDPEVVELSAVLNRLPIHTDRPDQHTFRNPNGVHMKLGNFKRVDPKYTKEGRVGLTRGNQKEPEVWERFADDPEGLARVVAELRARAEAMDAPAQPEEDEAEAVEGKILFRQHRHRERSRTLVNKKKAQVKKTTGRLACEVCDLDFEERYGEAGKGFIECHHLVPLAEAGEGPTRLSDLALVCPNCHRVLHREPTLGVSDLAELVNSNES